MDASRHLTEFIESVGQAFGHLADLRPELVQVRRNLRLDVAELHRKSHESLLCSVVEVALDASSRLVGGGEDPPAGGEELAAHGRVRYRRRDELGEAGKPLLRAGGGGVAGPAARDHEYPHAAVDHDR